MNSATVKSTAVRGPDAKMLPVLLAFLFLAGISFPAAGMQLLPGHVPSAIGALNLRPVGRPPATQQLVRLAIELPFRDQAGLTNLLTELYDPQSPQFHKFLTPDEFTARFGPSEADYAAAVTAACADRQRLCKSTLRARIAGWWDIRGSVADIERVFHVTMRLSIRIRARPAIFTRRTPNPLLNLTVPVAGHPRSG